MAVCTESGCLDRPTCALQQTRTCLRADSYAIVPASPSFPVTMTMAYSKPIRLGSKKRTAFVYPASV